MSVRDARMAGLGSALSLSTRLFVMLPPFCPARRTALAFLPFLRVFPLPVPFWLFFVAPVGVFIPALCGLVRLIVCARGDIGRVSISAVSFMFTCLGPIIATVSLVTLCFPPVFLPRSRCPVSVAAARILTGALPFVSSLTLVSMALLGSIG